MLNISTNQFKKKVKALGPCRMPLHLCKVYKHNNPVYTCFLDASKAYDRVNHWTLFRKLLNRSIHILIVRILMFW